MMQELLALSAHAIVRRSRSNFSASFFFLPKKSRRGMEAVYAFCRLSDDLVDLAPNAEAARQNLAEWKELLEASIKNPAQPNLPPSLVELAHTTREFHIAPELYRELIRGVEMDLTMSRYGTFEELYAYCYRVASVVGLICLPLFGADAARAKNYAVNLGLAFQLTNILRDVKTDSLRGRVYLPEDDLRKFNLSTSDWLRFHENPRQSKAEEVQALMLFECDRAENFYHAALQALPPQDFQSLLPAELMRAVYHRILERVKSHPLQPFQNKVSLSKFESLRLLLGAYLRHQCRT